MSDEGTLDRELLNQYARGFQEAFAQIVHRYVDLVYATCLRDLHDHHLAEDATQAVFLVLAQKAAGLRREVVLAGWLFQTARLVVRNVKKQEARRKARERRVAEMAQTTTQPDMAWSGLSPLLSEGLESLGGKDRDAVLLHYFQRKTMSEVGGSLGVSEDAARMRVSRAVEKLRNFFGRHGRTMAVGAVATLLMANGVQAAPSACSQSVVAAVCGTAGKAALASGTAAALAKATMKTMFVAKLKVAAALTAATLLVPTAGLATYHALSTQEQPPRAAVAVNTIVPDEPRPVTAPAPAPAAVAPRPSPAAATPAAPAKPQPKTTTKPTVSPAKPAAPAADLIHFKLENGLLTVVAPPTPLDGKPVRTAIRGLPGETTLARSPSELDIQNHRAGSDGGQIDTRIAYQPGVGLSIERTVKPRNGKEYAFIVRQSHRSDAAGKAAGQTTVQVTVDGGENWNSWAADDFPRFVETYPLAFFAHWAPLFRDFSARKFCIVPMAVARQVLTEAAAARPAVPLADLLARGDSGAAVIWRRELEMLRRDTGFLLDCLESDELDVRTSAVKRLNEATGRPVDFDPTAPPEKRKATINVLRRTLSR